MLIQWLRERQRADGLNDADFAAKLGICRSYWTMFKNGKRPRPTYLLAQSALRAYPDEREYLLSLFTDGVTTMTTTDISLTPERAIA